MFVNFDKTYMTVFVTNCSHCIQITRSGACCKTKIRDTRMHCGRTG